MKITFESCPGTGLEAVTEDGKTIKVKKLIITPLFRTAQGASEMVLGTATTKHSKVVDRFMLAAAGNTGKVTLRKHDPKGVEAAVDKAKASKSAEPEAEPERVRDGDAGTDDTDGQ